MAGQDPAPPAGPLAQKYIRIKRVKCNGKGAKRDTCLVQGDVLQLYINDEFFDTPTPENAFLSVFKPQLDIVYEDENLLLVNKRPGLVVHPDEQEKVNTLLTHIQAYLYQKKGVEPQAGECLRPRPVQPHRPEHRGHRHRRQERRDPAGDEPEDPGPGGGEVLPVHHLRGHHPPAGRLEGYLLKDEAKKLVSVHKTPVPGGRTAVTLYQTLAQKKRPVPGGLPPGHRPHPPDPGPVRRRRPSPAGDGKYGRARENKKYGRTGGQALCSYQLAFRFTTDAGCLAGLNGRVWTVDQVDFVTDYFPHVPLHP